MDFRAVDDGGKSVGREPLHYGRWEAIIVGCVPKRSCFQGVGGALTETIPTRKGKETTLPHVSAPPLAFFFLKAHADVCVCVIL